MAPDGNYLDIEVSESGEQYDELIETLETWGRAKFLRYYNEYDRNQDGYYHVVVKSWSNGPRLHLRRDGSDGGPSADGEWVRTVNSAGFIPHGFIESPTSHPDHVAWYLVPEDHDIDSERHMAKVEENLDTYEDSPFVEYVKDIDGVSVMNTFNVVSDEVVYIEHDWFPPEEVDALREDDGVELVGFGEEGGKPIIEVHDDR